MSFSLPILLLLLGGRRHRQPVRYLSLCSGIEAATAAWHRFGWKPVAFSEIEAFPSAVLKHHYPHVPNLGDMTRWREWSEELLASVDVLVGGTPCFTAGHMVLRSDGYVPIESIRPGDMVVSHEGRLQRVVRIGSKMASVGRMKMVGRSEGISCTPDHPFRTVNWRMQSTRRQNAYALIEHCGDPEWTKALDCPGKSWCSLTRHGVEQPELTAGRLKGAELLRFAGYYLGDGWVRRWSSKNKKVVCLGLNAEKYATFLDDFPGLKHSRSVMRTGVRVTVADTILAEWLLVNFGEKASGKRISAWVLSSEHRADLLSGYLVTDGYSKATGKFSASTISRSLAHGIASLAETLGHTSSVKFCKTPDTTVIEGRTVNQEDFWQVTWSVLDGFSKARVRHGYLIRRIKSFAASHDEMVFNIEVEGDNSYILDGAVVHNCQAFSVAGLRNSLSDERGNLTLVYAQILEHIDRLRIARGLPPCICVWENVPGVLSTKDNAFGCFLGALAGEDEPLVPSGKKWTNAGLVRGPERAIAWRVLDAQHFGVPQRRRRVFLVGSARKGFRPESVLFESDGVRRDSPPGRSTGEDLAPTLSARAKGGGGLGTDFDLDGGLVESASLSPRGADLLPNGRGTPGVQGGSRTSGDGEGPEIAATLDASFGRLQGCSGQDLNHGHSHLIAGTVSAKWAKGSGGPSGGPSGDECQNLIEHTLRGEGFDATQITHPENRSNPQPGDPCHPLAAGAHAPVVAFNLRGREGGAMPEVDPDGLACQRTSSGGSSRSYVVCPRLASVKVSRFNQTHGRAFETDSITTLSALRNEIGAEAFAEWGLGILVSFLPPEVLRQAVHGTGLRCPSVEEFGLVHLALSREEDRAERALQSVRKLRSVRRASFGWQSHEQQSLQLGAYMSKLPLPGTSALCILFHLWSASKGSRALRQALPADEKMGGSDVGKGQPIQPFEDGGREQPQTDLLDCRVWAAISRERILWEARNSGTPWKALVRRLVPVCCEFLQGFPRGYTAIPWRGKPAAECPDGPRYKALGNSMAVPCMAWIGKRLNAHLEVITE